MNRKLAGLITLVFILLPFAAYPIGILLPRAPEFSPIRLGPAEVRVEISGNLAKTRVIQDFINPNSRQLEADFFFPVPKGADVTDFVLYMDGKPVKGEVLEKEKAREIYEGIVRRMKDPGLIEWIDYNLFKVRVFPVPANGTQKIELEFAQPLEADQGMFRYTFPLRAPRSLMESSRPALDLKFTVNIKSDEPLANVYSPSHPISTDMKDPKDVKVSLTAPPTAAGGDFTLFYETSNKDVALSLLATRPGSDDGFFSLMISPKMKVDESKVSPNDVVFVIDSSGSMLDDNKINQARRALTYCVSQLKPRDRFSLIRFSTEVERFKEELLPATEEKTAEAKRWIEQLQARGATNISGALKEALLMKKTSIGTTGTTAVAPVFTVVFITDGLPTVGTTSAERIQAEVKEHGLGNVRIFTFGVGNDVNTKLLDALAADTRAASDYIRPGQDMELPISRFFDKISRPAMTNLKLELTNSETYDLYPKELPDLFFGTQLTVFGRYKKPGPTAIRLTGTVAGESAEFTYEKTLPEKEPTNEFVEKLWGTRKIGYLLDQIRAHGESSEVKDEVVRLAKKYGVVTPYTSYLVAEDVQVDGDSRRRADRVSPPSMAPFERRESLMLKGPVAKSDRRDMSGVSRGNIPAADSMGQAPALGAFSMAPGRTESAPAFSFSAESGAAAVNAAKAVQRLKEAKQEEAQGTSGIQKAGKTFVPVDGVWIDTEIQSGETSVLKIKYLSEAYFAAIRANPKLAEIFSLGERVRVKLAAGIVEVGPEGKEQLEDADLRILAP